MLIVSGIAGVLVLSALLWRYWRRHIHRGLWECLSEVAQQMPLAEVKLHRYPLPAAAGKYFGFQILLEGVANRGHSSRPYKIRGVIPLPQKIDERIYLLHESRPGSLKPIATLELVHTGHDVFDRQFVLLTHRAPAAQASAAQALFGPYLCEKFLALKEPPWLLDIHGGQAHLEFQVRELDSAGLCQSLQVVVEALNTWLILLSNKKGSNIQ